MSGLGETLAGLAALKKKFAGAKLDVDGPSAMAGLRGFGFNPGELQMLTYLPEGLARGSALVVVLHGCTQGAAHHAETAGWLTLADRYGFAVLAPEQRTANNPNRCFNWFEGGDIGRGGGEAASIHAAVDYMVRRHHLDQRRIFVTGLSAGGAMTLAMLAAYPETFAAGAVVSGLPYGVARSVHQAFSAMRHATELTDAELKSLVAAGGAPTPSQWPRLTIWQGSADSTVTAGNAIAIARQWTALLDLPVQPSRLEPRSGWTRQRWLDDDGAVMVETNLIAGLGHGMSLAASGVDPIGRAAPYMIETGISAALEITRFWRLAPQDTHGFEAVSTASETSLRDRTLHRPEIGRDVLAALAGRTSPKVAKVINDALIAAGLLK